MIQIYCHFTKNLEHVNTDKTNTTERTLQNKQISEQRTIHVVKKTTTNGDKTINNEKHLLDLYPGQRSLQNKHLRIG